MEAQEEALKDTVHWAGDVKQELEFVDHMDEALVTYRAELVNSTGSSTEVYIKDEETLAEIKLEKTDDDEKALHLQVSTQSCVLDDKTYSLQNNEKSPIDGGRAENFEEGISDSASAAGSAHRCLICSNVYDTHRSLNLHLNTHTSRFKCGYCDQRFLSAAGLENHIGIHKLAEEKSNKSGFNPLPDDGKLSYIDTPIKLESMHDVKEPAQETFIEERKLQKVSDMPTISTMTECLQCPEKKGEHNQHKCDFCEDMFAEPSLLAEHRNRHLEIKNRDTNQCHICFKSYKNKVHLYSHLIQHTARFKCEHCDKTFQRAKHLEVHIQRHLKIKPFKCNVCQASSATAGDLKVHMQVHSQGRYKCEVCGRAFFKKAMLEKHKNIHLDVQTNKCAYCPLSFSNFQYLTTHQNVCHNPDGEQNSSNDIAFEEQTKNTNTDDGLDSWDDTNMAEEKNLCDMERDKNESEESDQSFGNNALLKTHKNIHLSLEKCWIDWKAAVKRQYIAEKKFNRVAGILPASAAPKPMNDLDAGVIAFFVEDTLGQACGQQRAVELGNLIGGGQSINCDGDRKERDIPREPFRKNRPSKRGEENKVDQDKYACDFCGDTFPDSSLLEDHRNQHLEVQKHHANKCYICFKTYAYKSSLVTHLMTHTSRFKCEHCGKSLESARHLQVHVQGHLGIKPHQCTICKATYATAGSLKMHKLTHSKRFKCDHCGRDFLKQSSLENHINKHLGVKQHKCLFCARWFATYNSLMKHQNLYHKSELAGGDCGQLRDNEAESMVECNPARPANPSNVCPICSNIYASQHALKKHLAKHTNRYKCEHCDKSFQSAAHLKNHIGIHLRKNEKKRAKKSQLVDSQIDASESQSQAGGPDRDINFMQMESHDSSLKDVMYFNEEQEFKPSVDTPGEVASAGVCNFTTMDRSQISFSSTEQDVLLKAENGESGYIVKIENTDLSVEETILPSILSPIKFEITEISEELDSFNKGKYAQNILDSKSLAPHLGAGNQIEHSNNWEFLGEGAPKSYSPNFKGN